MERKGYTPQRYIPPDWCRDICLTADTTACVHHCARTRQGIYFLLDPTIPIEDMPEFPIKDWIYNSSPKERQIIAGAYLAKLVEQAQGREAVPYYENDELEEFIVNDIDSWVQALVDTSKESA